MTPPIESTLQSDPASLKALPPELWPNIDHIQIEDGAPVDSVFSEKQMRLLTEPLHTSWKPDWPFVAFANVGLFYGVNIPPLVPDVLLSMHVRMPEDLKPKLNRSYFVWGYGKPPEVVIEIVSNKEGREDTEKLELYADVRVSNYFIYDPDLFLSDMPLRGYQLVGNKFSALPGERFHLPDAGLGLSTWRGRYEDVDSTWLRWTDSNWKLIPTGAEKAQRESQRADSEAQRADSEAQRADSEAQRADAEAQQVQELAEKNARLLEMLRKKGFDPEAE